MAENELDRTDVPYWGRVLSRRVDRLEALEPAVLAERVKALAEEVHALKRAFYTFTFSVVCSAIVLAFTTFALLGKHP